MLSFAKTPGPAVLRTAKLRRSFPALKPTLRTEYVQNAASCSCGGGCPRCRGEAPVQPKLAIGVPGEAFEQEADRIADQVMSMPNPQVHGSPALLGVQRKCAACEEEEKSKLQTKRDQSHAGAATAPPIVHEALRSPGQPLDDSTRAFMEPHFGRDFRTVRVHTDARAADSARAVNALAYTVGRDVVFGGGQYRPRSRAGARLLAHELTHVTQQQGNPPVLARQSPEEKSTDEPEAQALGVEVAPAASQAPDLCQCDPPIPAGESCAARHAEKAVLDAFNEARSWLPGAAQKINDFLLSNPDGRATSPVTAALLHHFQVAAGSPDEQQVAERVAEQIAVVVNNTMRNINEIACSHCLKTCSGSGSGSGSGSQEGPGSAGSNRAKDAKFIAAMARPEWANTNCIQYCPLFIFGLDITQRARTVLHEMMHNWENMADIAYEGFGPYPPATPLALNNADSYACLIRDLR